MAMFFRCFYLLNRGGHLKMLDAFYGTSATCNDSHDTLLLCKRYLQYKRKCKRMLLVDTQTTFFKIAS